jgi:plasmid stability protein
MPKPAKKVDLQIRSVPAELRRKVARRAASKGLSMSKYVIDVLTDEVDRPATIDEWLAEVARHRGPPRDLGFDPAAIVREIRDEIDRGERL